MKRFVFLAAALFCTLLAVGCQSRQYATIEEAVRDGARLGENIIIDGVDVSGLEILEARRVLSGAQEQRIAELSYTVRARGEDALIRGTELGTGFNTDSVLAHAASLPPKKSLWKEETRTFTTSISVSETVVLRVAQQTALSLNRQPSDAEVYYDEQAETEFSYRTETVGFEVDEKDLALRLTQGVLALEGGVIEAQASDIPADYTLADAQNDTQLICEFSTSFKGSTYSKANRVFNIVKAAGLINRAVIEPEEIFSINDALGPRNGENGWKMATGIRYGAYVQEYGGGVCQVSSTLYNAALMADLEITERTYHSWPLGYIAAGRDATISTGGPDLCFRNTTGARLFIRAFTNEREKTITVRLYGRPPANGVTIRVTSKKTGTLEDLGTEVTVDPSLAPGETQVVRESHVGITTETYQEYYAADGSLIERKLVSRDKYRSIQGIMLIGPAAPSPSPTPTPTPTPGETTLPGSTPQP